MELKALITDLKSWKTTLVGWLTGITIIVPELIAYLDTNPETIMDLPTLLTGVAIFGIGTLAKDGDKSTEDVK